MINMATKMNIRSECFPPTEYGALRMMENIWYENTATETNQEKPETRTRKCWGLPFLVEPRFKAKRSNRIEWKNVLVPSIITAFVTKCPRSIMNMIIFKVIYGI